jgi:hypothetical protein
MQIMNFFDWLKIVGNIIGSIGGIGAIVVWLANWWGKRIAERISNKEKAHYDQELERLRTQLELSKVTTVRYSEQQFNIYNQLWASLYELQSAGARLWESANQQNLVNFAGRLRETKEMMEKNSLFIDERHYFQLKNLMRLFSDYEFGKKRLIELRTTDRIDRELIDDLVETNHEDLVEYTRIIEEIRTTFRQQLNAHIA